MPALIAGGALLALLALLAVEIMIVRAAEYLPTDPGYVVEATVGPAASAEDPLELVLLGDSTAAGVGSPTAAEALPVLVAERVARLVDRRVHVVGHGVSGARSDTVRREQVPLLEGAKPDVVLIVVGSNDVTHVTPPWRMGPCTSALIDSARATAQAPVVLGGIPEFRTTPALPQPLRLVTGLYGDLLRRFQARAAAEAGAPFVNIAAEASPRFLGEPESMSVDGFHPSPIGYGYWADALAPPVAAAVTAAERDR